MHLIHQTSSHIYPQPLKEREQKVLVPAKEPPLKTLQEKEICALKEENAALKEELAALRKKIAPQPTE